MKIHNRLFMCCLLAGSISLQQTGILHASQSPAQSTQDAAQAAADNAKLKAMLRSAVKDLGLCLWDLARLQNFIEKNPNIISKVPTILMETFSLIRDGHNNSTGIAENQTSKAKNSNTAELIQTLKASSLTDLLIQMLTGTSQLLTKVSHAITETTDIINNSVELIKNNKDKLFNEQNLEILTQVIERTLDKSETTALIDFFKTKTPEKLCNAIVIKPQVFFTVIQEYLTRYKDVLATVKDKIQSLKIELSQSTPKTV